MILNDHPADFFQISLLLKSIARKKHSCLLGILDIIMEVRSSRQKLPENLYSGGQKTHQQLPADG